MELRRTAGSLEFVLQELPQILAVAQILRASPNAGVSSLALHQCPSLTAPKFYGRQVHLPLLQLRERSIDCIRLVRARISAGEDAFASLQTLVSWETCSCTVVFAEWDEGL